MLILGEVYIDYTLPTKNQECKLRLGGIVHAARGLWANDIEYSAAIICPSYLVDQVTKYLKSHGCNEVILIGEVFGSPNVISYSDPREIGNQGYDDLLRNEKNVVFSDNAVLVSKFKDILIFPGKYCLRTVFNLFGSDSRFSIDIAYGIENIDELEPVKDKIEAIFLSTSSDFFLRHGTENVTELIYEIKKTSPDVLILKENRGGSRLFNFISDSENSIPAMLSKTKNSVGVGDVYSAVCLAKKLAGSTWEDSVWYGAISATCYSQTTFPDDFKKNVIRSNNTQLDKHKSLGGTHLSWHSRPLYNIYLAAPDFTYVDREFIDLALSCLKYHNFNIRRPVIENGELNESSSDFERHKAFFDDCELINHCDLVFAIPLNRDPGTLVEIGIAIEKNIPVITYDPIEQNDNNMVIKGSKVYSPDLDECLNRLFYELSRLEEVKWRK